MAYQVHVHKLTSEPIAFDFSKQKAFLDNPTLTIASVLAVAAHDEKGLDVTAAVFDSGKEHQVDGLVVKVWVHTPPGGTLDLTCAVACSDDQVVVWQDPAEGELPQLVVNAEGADPAE